jgi:diadenosine tetraphosphate (Ap4A) HIT family hydrolase
MSSDELGANYESLKIKGFDFWDLYMHENQCYLGRTYILSKRLEQADMFDISKGECDELKAIVLFVKKVLNKLFVPDLFNYASLGNVFKRLHLHVIPRYKTDRAFCNMVFTDRNWGRNYAPYDKSFSADAEVHNSLRRSFMELGSA